MCRALILPQWVLKALRIISNTWRFEQLSRCSLSVPCLVSPQPQPCPSEHAGVREALASLDTCLMDLTLLYSFFPFLWETFSLST